MPLFQNLMVNAVAKAVTPSAFELDKFTLLHAEAIRVTIINTDGVQTLEGYVETRPVAGTGTWCRHSTSSLAAIGPGEGREELVDITGSGEVRVMATASGAGLTATYSRKNIYRGTK